MYEVIFLDMQTYVYFESVFNTIYIEKNTIVKKYPPDKINGKKMPSFFFRELQFITVLVLI